MNFKLEEEITQLIKRKIGNCKIGPIKISGTNAMIYKLTVKTKTDFYLKVIVNFDLAESLLNEKIIYDWLLGKILVPSVKFYKKTKKFEAICLTAIEGQNLYDLIGVVSNEEITKIYARILKELHSISIENCKIKISLDQRLIEIRQRIASDKIAIEDFEEENRRKTPEELFGELLIKMRKIWN